MGDYYHYFIKDKMRTRQHANDHTARSSGIYRQVCLVQNLPPANLPKKEKGRFRVRGSWDFHGRAVKSQNLRRGKALICDLVQKFSATVISSIKGSTCRQQKWGEACPFKKKSDADEKKMHHGWDVNGCSHYGKQNGGYSKI